MADSISNQEFLQAVFGKIPDDESIGICTFEESPDDRKFWPVFDARRDDVQEALTEIGNAFYCISTVERQAFLKRRKHALRATYVIPLDDIGTGTGAKTSPGNVPLEPSYSIETSPGNYQYGYVLAEPLTDMATATALIKIVAEIADTGAAIPNKLIRLPYGKNSKEKYGKPAPMTQLDIWAPERLFTVEELLKAWRVPEETFNRMVEGLRVSTSASSVILNKDGVRDEVLDWLAHKDLLITDAPNSAGFYDVVCPWHDSHTSNDTGGTGYSPIGEGGYENEGSRQFKCLHDHCSTRGEGDLLAWMAHERFAYNTAEGCVHDVLNPTWRSKSLEHFRTTFAGYWFWVKNPETGRLKKVRVPDAWLDDKRRQEVKREVFFPNEAEMGVRTDIVTGRREFNTFEPRSGRVYTENTDGRLSTILGHLRYLFGSEYDNALGFLAYTVHRPYNRLPFALLHTANYHGTGRGWFKLLVAALVGHDYFRNASFHNFLHGNYNEFLYRSLVVSFDEVYDQHNRFTVGERLRELVTEKHVELNVKYGYKGEADIYANFMFFSNHHDALKITSNDRRFWVVQSHAQPKPQSHYVGLYNLLEDAQALDQLWSYLKRVLATTSFNPKGRAPVTEWTADAHAASETVDFDAPIKEIVNKLRMLDVKAVYRAQLINDCRLNGAELPEPMHPKTSASRHFESYLKELNVHRRSARIVRSGGRHEYVYFLQHMPTAGNAEIVEECERALTFSQPKANLKLLK